MQLKNYLNRVEDNYNLQKFYIFKNFYCIFPKYIFKNKYISQKYFDYSNILCVRKFIIYIRKLKFLKKLHFTWMENSGMEGTDIFMLKINSF